MCVSGRGVDIHFTSLRQTPIDATPRSHAHPTQCDTSIFHALSGTINLKQALPSKSIHSLVTSRKVTCLKKFAQLTLFCASGYRKWTCMKHKRIPVCLRERQNKHNGTPSYFPSLVKAMSCPAKTRAFLKQKMSVALDP